MNAYFLFAQAAGGFSDAFAGIESDKRFVLIIIGMAFAMGFVLGLAGIIAGTIGAVHRRNLEANMKREMIERGMTADEITKIIESAAPPEDATQRWIASWAKCKK